MSVALSLRHVSKSFGPLKIIEDVDLDVLRGERHALIGPNGAGKSTLFNLISGRIPPSGGMVFLNNARISGQSPAKINRLGLSRSFQISNIFPLLTTLENLRLGVYAKHGLRFGIFRSASRLKQVNLEAEQLAERVGLLSFAHVPSQKLTYSQQRALEIGMTLATNPSVILLDEPTAGMSRDETAQTIALIKQTTADSTLLVIEHDMSVVFGLSDRISVLANGKILATGTPAEIEGNPEVQHAYLGDTHR